jgi:anti-anti-sigma factor
MIPEPHVAPDEVNGAPAASTRPATAMDRPATGVLVVYLHGDRDQLACDLVQAQVVEELVRIPTCRLILDLTDVDALTNAGIRMLLHLRRLCRTRDIRLLLVGAGHPGVHVPLRCSGVLPLLTTRSSVNYALPGPSLTAPRRSTR